MSFDGISDKQSMLNLLENIEFKRLIVLDSEYDKQNIQFVTLLFITLYFYRRIKNHKFIM